ncbi:MAG: GNAT family N-acetyltransferase [Prolixibacteraceae bacterium]
MIVREAAKEEYNCIVEFQLAMAIETEDISLDRATVEKGVKAVLADDTRGRYYVAEIEGRIAGSLLTTYEWSDWRNGTILWIQSVYVLPEFRRRGVYRNLYSHVKKMVLLDNRLNGIRLYADKSNKAAHETYRKLGMMDDHYVTFEWLK